MCLDLREREHSEKRSRVFHLMSKSFQRFEAGPLTITYTDSSKLQIMIMMETF